MRCECLRKPSASITVVKQLLSRGLKNRAFDFVETRGFSIRPERMAEGKPRLNEGRSVQAGGVRRLKGTAKAALQLREVVGVYVKISVEIGVLAGGH